MIIYLLRKFFKIIIGELPPEQKTVFWNKFNTLLEEATKAGAAIAEAGAKGAVEGAIKNNQNI